MIFPKDEFDAFRLDGEAKNSQDKETFQDKEALGDGKYFIKDAGAHIAESFRSILEQGYNDSGNEISAEQQEEIKKMSNEFASILFMQQSVFDPKTSNESAMLDTIISYEGMLFIFRMLVGILMSKINNVIEESGYKSVAEAITAVQDALPHDVHGADGMKALSVLSKTLLLYRFGVAYQSGQFNTQDEIHEAIMECYKNKKKYEESDD